MVRSVVVIAGSPKTPSRSSFVAASVTARIETFGGENRTYSVADFDPSDVLNARFEAPAIRRLVDDVRSSAAIVLASPVYKASYAGLLKAIVDLVPPDALVDRPLLGIATTRLPEHGAETAEAYRALARFFRARSLTPLVVLDDQMTATNDGWILSPDAEQRVAATARDLQQTFMIQD